MLCLGCATDNRPGAARCRRCGAGLPRSCAGCGGPVQHGEALCSSCRTEQIPSPLGGAAEPDSDAIPLEEIDELLTDSLPPEAPRFIGRTQLLTELASRVEHAHTSRRLVLATITGEAGVGKTRLGAELCRICEADHPLRVLWGTADETTPYSAFRRLLRQRFGITDDDTVSQARTRVSDEVRALLSSTRQRELVELLLQFLGFPPDDLVLSEELDVRAENTVQLEARTFLAIRRILAADAQRAPLLLVLDDMDRAAIETVNLVLYLAAGLDASSVAILVLGRPSLYTQHPALAGVGDVAVERHALLPLEPQEASDFLKERLGLGELDDRLAAWAAHQLGGVPRALVELARFLSETGAVKPADGARPASIDASALQRLAMPDSLEQILAARLELLEPSERDLLEKAAAVGEVFWLDALVALVRSTALEPETPDGPSLDEINLAGDRPRPAIEASLSALQRRGFIVEQPISSIPGERELRFAYPPWWEVVSQRLQHDNQRRYHRLIAEWLELRPEGRREEAQEEIGRHLELAGLGDEAALRYRRAGDAARARYYNEKAIRLYEAAIACTSPGNVSRRILLWHDLGSVQELRGNVEAALNAFEHMLRLSWVVVSRSKAAVALNKLGRIYRQKGELQQAIEYLDKGRALFREARDHRGIAGSLDDLGQTLWLLGRYDEALDRSAAGLEQRRKLGDKRSIASSLLNIGNIERHRGLFVPAEACYREALELRTQLNDRHGIAQCQNALGVLAFLRGDVLVAKASWEAALDAAVDIGAAQLEALLLIHLGEAARSLGHHEEARVRFEEAIARATEIGERRLLSDAERQLGLVALHFGDTVAAKQRCTSALRLAESSGIQVLIGRALVALGEVEAVTLFDDTGSPAQRAPEYYKRGVEVFRTIRNDSELAWALERFGRFSVERGELEAGRTLLEEAARLFTRLGLPQGQTVWRVLEDL